MQSSIPACKLQQMKKSKKSSKLRVALVYDRINKWGGAERILLLLHEMFPSAPVYTSVYDPIAAPWAKDLSVRTSFLERIPYARRHHEFFATLMPLAFESFNFDSYDLVISLTSEAAKGVIVKPQTKHICICLTPTRYLWSEYDSYFPSGWGRVLTFPFVLYLRIWDKVAAKRPDKFISISETVQNRVKRYYGRDSELLYPPLFLEKGKGRPVGSRETDGKSKKGYFLVVSRLSRFTPHKRVEIAIKAANKLKLPLKIVGGGDVSYFRSLSGPTVEIVGQVNDEKLSEYYENCSALIFPGVEDFGLVMVEAQAFGKPVIAYAEGGALEIVKPGKTGEFFHKPNSSSLVKTLKLFDKNKYNSKDCIANSRRFNKDKFTSMLITHIKEVLS